MNLRSIAAACCFFLLVAACSSGDDDAVTTTSSQTATSLTPAQTTTTAVPPSTVAPISTRKTTETGIAALPGGLFCRDLVPLGFDYAGAVAYWLREGSPGRMDAARNGIPCETVYPTGEVEAYWAATTTAWGGPPWTALDAIRYVEDVPESLRTQLAATGFAVDTSAGSPHMGHIYDALYPYGGRPVFVTTDAAFHTWHLVFDKLLRDSETEELLPALEAVVADLVAAARAQTDELDGTGLADAASRVEEHLEAVATVLEVDVGPIGVRATDEVALVNEHTEFGPSPTVGGVCSVGQRSGCVDYSRMKPRGHYTRTEDLTRFFKAMSLLGNTPFGLDQTDPFRVGLLLSRLLVADESLVDDWATIYDVTSVIVGASDDYTPLEAAAAADAVVDGGLDDPLALASDSVVQAIAAELAATRPVEIDPEAASLRTMGVRFILDSYMLDQLADPTVPGRGAVSALDVAAALGSDFALDRQQEADPTATSPEYEQSMRDLRGLVDSKQQADWSETVYDAWLYALQSSFDAPAAVDPPFMQSEAWAAKAHQSALGSYTELKHDTILYGKEGMAEGDMEPPPTVVHWVEPDPETFSRIAATARLMGSTLQEFDMLAGAADDWNSPAGTLNGFIEVVERLEKIAQSEMQGEPPAAADREWLDSIGGELTSFVDRTAYVGDDGIYGSDPYGALVADIFLNGFADEALEQGTGLFDRIYVVVPDGAGGFQVATGGVYSYYEFWQPRENRLSDEQWWEIIEDGQLPARPWWVTEYLGP